RVLFRSDDGDQAEPAHGRTPARRAGRAARAMRWRRRWACIRPFYVRAPVRQAAPAASGRVHGPVPGAGDGYPVAMTIECDVLVIGAGAAGLMCALTAGQRGRQMRVVERANRPGKKILMSGGGRCNFTNTGTSPANFLSANPHFCKSALARYTPADFIDMVDRHGIAWHEKELGQLFCNESSKQIVRMLLDECDAAGA